MAAIFFSVHWHWCNTLSGSGSTWSCCKSFMSAIWNLLACPSLRNHHPCHPYHNLSPFLKPHLSFLFFPLSCFYGLYCKHLSHLTSDSTSCQAPLLCDCLPRPNVFPLCLCQIFCTYKLMLQCFIAFTNECLQPVFWYLLPVLPTNVFIGPMPH